MSIFSLLMSSCQGSAEGGQENRNPNQNVRLKPRYKILLNLQSKANLNLKVCHSNAKMCQIVSFNSFELCISYFSGKSEPLQDEFRSGSYLPFPLLVPTFQHILLDVLFDSDATLPKRLYVWTGKLNFPNSPFPNQVLICSNTRLGPRGRDWH